MSRPGTGLPPRSSRGARLRLVVALAAVASVAVGVIASRRSAHPRPNVLVLVMDTTRGDRCSVDGYARPTTPRLAEFAKDAVTFRDAWSPANWTGPAHASLFTGLRPEHHGFYEGNRRFLAPSADTLATRLGEAGYSTACFTNNSAVSSSFGLVQGFRTVEPLYGDPNRPYPWAKDTHDRAFAWAAAEARAGRPFFLFVNDMEPHLPYTPPQDVADRFVTGSPNPAELDAMRNYAFPRNVAYVLGVEELSDFEKTLLSDLYDAEIATLDAEIGHLLDRLREEHLLDDTVVVIASDHGENLGGHHLFEHGLGLHRTLCHVPLVVRVPGVLDGGRVLDDVVRLEDVYPTVIEACGLEVPPGKDGVSLARDLPGRVARARQSEQERERVRAQEIYGPVPVPRVFRAARSVYDGHFHLIAGADGIDELFDVRRDPDEIHDLSAADPAEVARLRALLPEVAPEVAPDRAVPPTPK